MTIAAFTGCGGIMVPDPPWFTSAAPGVGTTFGTLDASTERRAYLFEVPKTGTLDKAEFRLGAVTFNGASVFRVSFQNVDLTTGFPDATQDQYRDMTALSANAWNAPGLMTSDGTDGGAKRSVTKGDLLAVVFEYQTFTAADSVVLSYLDTSSVFGNFPYGALFTGTWAANTGTPLLALKYNDGSYHVPIGSIPVASLNSVTTFNTGSTPDERGLLFQFPFPVEVEGAWVRTDLDGDAELILYDNADVAQRTVTLDKDVDATAAGAYRRHIFSSALSLSANTNYRLVMKPTSATNLSVYDWLSGVSLANYIGGSTWKYTERTDAGVWTDTADKRPWMGLILSGFDDAAGGGGGFPDVIDGGPVV